MLKLIGRLMVLVLAGWAGSASASLITDTITADGKEWAQVDLFLGLTWNEINAVCPAGICLDNGVLSGYEMTGWTWASYTEVGDLFIAFGVPNSILVNGNAEEVDSSWAPAIYNAFRTSDSNGSQVLSGNSSTPHPIADFAAFAPRLFDLVAGIADRAEIDNPDDKSAVIPYSGAWMYRVPSEVPVPATLALFSIGLAGLGWSRRKHHGNRQQVI